MTAQAENLEILRIVAPPGAHGDYVIDLVRTSRLTAHGTGSRHTCGCAAPATTPCHYDTAAALMKRSTCLSVIV